MKKFTKLALAASVALSANAMAMQAMDDSTLSATTGQDGINIGIGISKVEIGKLFVHDNDGYTGAGGTGEAGAIVIQGNKNNTAVNTTLVNPANGNPVAVNLSNIGVYVGANYADGGKYLLDSRNLADIQIDSDAGTNGAFLNIAAQVSGLEIHIGEIGVTASGTQGSAINLVDGKESVSAIRRGAKNIVEILDEDDEPTGRFKDSSYNAILSGLSIKTGQLSANVQLGTAPQGAMIKLNSVIQGGLTIENLGILDNSTKDHTYSQVLLTPAVLEVKDGQGNITTAAQPEVRGNAYTREAGEIFIKSIKITDAESKDLTVDASVKVYNNAYKTTEITDTDVKKQANVTIISTSGAHDMYLEGIHLGSRAAGNSIGDVEIQGMQTYYSPAAGTYLPGSVITISGR